MRVSAESRDVRPLKTLERVISKSGLGSRTEARSWIHAGRVAVNGRLIENPDHWVDLERDRVTFDGQPLRRRAPVYVLLHKPAGYLTTYRDPQGRPTVYDLLDGVDTFVSPVGRLDLETSGLLLLTNDTALANHVTSPASHVPKTYLVTASRVLDAADLQRLRDGVTLGDGPTRPAVVDQVHEDGTRHTRFRITITEGRNRQVRRMVEALGAVVLDLVRTRIGSIQLGTLDSGRWRHLSPDEVAALRPRPVTSGRNTRDRPSAPVSGGLASRARARGPRRAGRT
jgi:pseudouridine synthase